jgi:hypothetical protein
MQRPLQRCATQTAQSALPAWPPAAYVCGGSITLGLWGVPRALREWEVTECVRKLARNAPCRRDRGYAYRLVQKDPASGWEGEHELVSRTPEDDRWNVLGEWGRLLPGSVAVPLPLPNSVVGAALL